MNLFKLLYGAATKKQFTIATDMVALRGEATWRCVVAGNLGQVGTQTQRRVASSGSQRQLPSAPGINAYVMDFANLHDA